MGEDSSLEVGMALEVVKVVWEGWTKRSWSTPWSMWPPTSSLVLDIRVGNTGDWVVQDRGAFWGLHLGLSNPVDMLGLTKQDMGWELGVLAMVDNSNKEVEFGPARRRRDGQVQLRGEAEQLTLVAN